MVTPQVRANHQHRLTRPVGLLDSLLLPLLSRFPVSFTPGQDSRLDRSRLHCVSLHPFGEGHETEAGITHVFCRSRARLISNPRLADVERCLLGVVLQAAGIRHAPSSHFITSP